MAALQQARAQALLQRQQAALQRSTLANANSVPNNIGQTPALGNGTTAEQARNINQLKQATLATTAPVAGAGAQGLPATQGILHMQALQHELIRQQQAQLQAKQQQQLKLLPQAANATADIQNAASNTVSANTPVRPVGQPVRPQGPPMNARPAGEIVIWKGKISTQPSRFQQDAKARDGELFSLRLCCGFSPQSSNSRAFRCGPYIHQEWQGRRLSASTMANGL
jgi:hypothetical protein